MDDGRRTNRPQGPCRSTTGEGRAERCVYTRHAPPLPPRHLTGPPNISVFDFWLCDYFLISVSINACGYFLWCIAVQCCGGIRPPSRSLPRVLSMMNVMASLPDAAGGCCEVCGCAVCCVLARLIALQQQQRVARLPPVLHL